jgi:hypothetical protein
MARAMMKLPRKRKMIGSAKGAIAVLTLATPVATQSEAPSRAVAGIGTGSVIHQVMTQPMIAARTWAFRLKPFRGRR